MTEAKRNLEQGVAAEKGTAAGIRQAVRESRPQVRRVYSENARSLGEADTDLDRDLSVLSAAADPYKAVAAREAAGAKRRLSTALGGALDDLRKRELEAAQGAAYAQSNLRQQYRTEVGKVRGEQRGLAKDIGAFIQGTYGELRQSAAEARREAEKIAMDRRTLEAELTGIDPATGRPTAEERGARREHRLAQQTEARLQAESERKARGKKGPSRGAISEHQQIVSAVQDARADARAALRGGVPRNQIVNVLVASRGTDVKGKGQSPFGGHDRIYAQAAVQTLGGQVDPGTWNALRHRGLLPRRAPGRWRPGWRSPWDQLFD